LIRIEFGAAAGNIENLFSRNVLFALPFRTLPRLDAEVCLCSAWKKTINYWLFENEAQVVEEKVNRKFVIFVRFEVKRVVKVASLLRLSLPKLV
jgi:hypothetical protein